MNPDNFYILMDFDGTLVKHAMPEIGEDIGAVPYLRAMSDAGVKIILWTVRSTGYNGIKRNLDQADCLTPVVEWFVMREISLYGINENPDQKSWSQSPKAYGHILVDDIALGCPLIYPENGDRPYADWSIIGPELLKRTGVKL